VGLGVALDSRVNHSLEFENVFLGSEPVSANLFFFRATAEEYVGGGRRIHSHSTIL
jgi:hypothetical protein